MIKDFNFRNVVERFAGRFIPLNGSKHFVKRLQLVVYCSLKIITLQRLLFDNHRCDIRNNSTRM